MPNHIRWSIRRDIPEILEIDKNTWHHWCEKDFITELCKRSTIGMVAEQTINESTFVINGFMLYELHKNKLEIVRLEAKNNDVSVIKELIAKIKTKLSSHRRTKIVYVASEYTPVEILNALKEEGFYSSIERGAFDYGEVDGYKLVYYHPIKKEDENERGFKDEMDCCS